MSKPDTITVTASRRDQIAADKVDLFVTLKDSSLVTGPAALERANGLSQLAKALHGTGVNPEHISLVRIRALASSGLLDHVGTTNYQVRVRCQDLNNLAAVLGTVIAQRHATLDGLVWGFPDDKRLRNRWLRACLTEAKERATLIAAGLGVRLLGVHHLTETWKDGDAAGHARPAPADGGEGAVQLRPQSAEPGITLAQVKTLELHLTVEFRVGELPKADAK